MHINFMFKVFPSTTLLFFALSPKGIIFLSNVFSLTDIYSCSFKQLNVLLSGNRLLQITPSFRCQARKKKKNPIKKVFMFKVGILKKKKKWFFKK